MKFIYNSDEIIDKDLYIEIFETALSSAEKFCLMLVCRLDVGVLKADREYIERSQILAGLELPMILR